MLQWLSAFAANLADAMFWPLIVGTIAGLIGIAHGFDVRSKAAYSSDANTDARWRIWAITQGLLIMWFAFLLVDAIPVPNYIYRDRLVEKTVERKSLSTYNEAYDFCKKGFDGSDIEYSERDKKCHDRAIMLLMPNIRVLHENVTITKHERDPYASIYQQCVNGWDVRSDAETKLRDGTVLHAPEFRKIRSDTCHIEAMQARGTPIPDKVNHEVVEQIRPHA